MRLVVLAALLLPTLLAPAPLSAQDTQGSRNVKLSAHVPLLAHGAPVAVALDQEGETVYVAHENAVSIIDARSGLRVETRTGVEGITGIADAADGFLLSTQTGLVHWSADGSRTAADIGPVRSVFLYRHSTAGAVMLAATSEGIRMLAGPAATPDLVPIPDDIPNRDRGIRDVYAAFHLPTESDRLYAAGGGGYFVWDITRPESPELLTWVNSAAVQEGSAIQATPDGTHLVTTTAYRSAPVRIFDIRPALDGTVSQVRTAAGAWTADWKSYASRFEVRWPYVFVAARDGGFQMFNMRNAFEPYTTAWFRTSNAVDVDVRNRDGLVAVADAESGLWLIRVEDFRSWDGRGWGVGNISAVQDWERGPTSADRW